MAMALVPIAIRASRTSIIIIAVNSEIEKSQVSRSSVVASLKPTMKTWASPIRRAMIPPTGSPWSFSMGHDKTPRSAFARMFARVRWFAVRNHHLFPICARRLSAQPPTYAKAAKINAFWVAVPFSSARAVSIALPKRSGGRTTAMFMMMPDTNPKSSSPAT